jgi:hypothetical protein
MDFIERDGWESFLRRWSAEWICVAGSPKGRAEYPPEVREAGWLGYGPASESAIAATEVRLGVPLPPSYRRFLAVSDGWRDTSPFIYSLASAADVGWFRDVSRDTFDVWAETAGYDVNGDPEDQDPTIWEPVLLSRALQISTGGDAAALLLDPHDVGPDGEWAAYFFSSWNPGLGKRHPSFAALMLSEFETFHALKQPAGPTRDDLAARVSTAHQDILAGRLDPARETLDEGRRFGLPSARLLNAQLAMFLGRRRDAKSTLLLLFPHRGAALAEDPFVAQEVVPLLVAPHLRFNRHHVDNYRAAPPDDGAILAELLNRRVDEVAQGRETITFGDPGFDAAARRARELAVGGDPDDAWAVLLAAVPAWQPASTYALAPVGLFADPVLAALITPARGEELLRIPRGRLSS